MKIFTNRATKQLFLTIVFIIAIFFGLSLLVIWYAYRESATLLLMLSLLAMGGILVVCFQYFHKQNKIIEAAAEQINGFLNGNAQARIACDEEGELFKLFHEVNTLTAVLNAHAENEMQSKEFLKNTISDISHQLKTPLAALSIYNGLLQDEAEELPEIKEFSLLSEKELDRMESLVQSLLKITKLDAGSIALEKTTENIADMVNEIQLRFAYRAKQEQKEIILSGADDLMFFCDHDWMMEALGNLVKNALDHTSFNGKILIEWKRLAALTQITVKDDGSGIHPEDIHHIFKRFYRSRFSQDTQGTGLGLPITKVIVEAHDGTITADSVLGKGTTFSILFVNPTKL